MNCSWIGLISPHWLCLIDIRKESGKFGEVYGRQLGAQLIKGIRVFGNYQQLIVCVKGPQSCSHFMMHAYRKAR